MIFSGYILCNKLTAMSSPQELTTITRMRRDFEAFIGERHSNNSGNPRKRKSLKCTLDFDETLTECDINNENVAFCSKRGNVYIDMCVFLKVCVKVCARYICECIFSRL